MSRPEPRPALQRAEDGSVHPAAPRVEPEQHLHPVPPAPSAASRRSLATAASTSRSNPASTSTTAASSAASYSGKPATLSVEIPKDLRKRVRRIAERSGVTVDAVVTDALTQHVTNSGPNNSSPS